MSGHFSEFVASRQSTSFVRTGLLHGDREALGDDVYLEMIVYLHATVWPLIVVGCGYLALSIMAFATSRDPYFAVVGLCGVLVSATRIAFVLSFRSQPQSEQMAVNAAFWERRYFICGLAFGTCLGLLVARVFFTAPIAEPFAVALLYSYGAGLAARVCMRPRIAVGALMLAGIPAIVGMIVRGTLIDLCLAAFTGLFMSAALETIFSIYKSIVANLTLRYEFASLARHDELTGLPNRLLVREKLSHEIARVLRHGGLVAVHYLDLDNFKTINDKFGHPTGDVLLRHVAERLQQLLRADDVVGRLGGDEFLLVQTGLAHQGEAEVLAMRVIRALGQPFEIEGKNTAIGASAGIAVAPTDATDISVLIKLADAALYKAKSQGRSRYAFHKERSGKFTVECENAQKSQSASA